MQCRGSFLSRLQLGKSGIILFPIQAGNLNSLVVYLARLRGTAKCMVHLYLQALLLLQCYWMTPV